MSRSTTGTTDWSRTSTVLLETRRRNGIWVPTPVSLVTEGSGPSFRAWFRTYDAAGKAKRLRNLPEVRVAPATLRGRPLGPAVPARARLLDGLEAQHARELLARRYPLLHGRLVPWVLRRKGWTTLHYELVLDES